MHLWRLLYQPTQTPYSFTMTIYELAQYKPQTIPFPTGAEYIVHSYHIYIGCRHKSIDSPQRSVRVSVMES